MGKKRLGEVRSGASRRCDFFAGSGKSSGFGGESVKSVVSPAFRCLYDVDVVCSYKKYEGYTDISDICDKCKFFIDSMRELAEEDERVMREIDREHEEADKERFVRERALLLKQMEVESVLERRACVRDSDTPHVKQEKEERRRAEDEKSSS